MNVLFFAIFLFSQSQAGTFEIFGKEGEVLYKQEQSFNLPTNVGRVSVEIFDKNGIAYQGGESGVSELFGLGQSIEVISADEMKAFGWCFSIDKEVPDTMPDQTIIVKQDSEIQWFYGYAHYKGGEWMNQCKRP